MAKKATAAKQAVEGASRVNAFRINADFLLKHVRVIGRDTDHAKGEHVLWDKSAIEPADRALVNSLKLFGWKPGSAILLRKDGEDFDVVNGRKRTIAARVGNEELEAEGSDMRIEPIAFVEKAEDGDIVTSMVLLNELAHVDDLLERGRKALVMQRAGKSLKEIASAFGVTTQAIGQWLKLPQDCDAKIIHAIEKGEIAGSMALELAALPREKQVEAFERLKAEGKLSVGEAKKAVHIAKPKNAEGGKRLPLTAVRKICKLHGGGKLEADLDPMALKVLRCLMGEIEVNAIKGMSAALREVGFE